MFPEGLGEYTSWYQDSDFVGQYGVETSSLKPGGKNPQDDFNSVTSNTLQLMRTHTINVFGAISRLTVGVDNVRRLWNIKPSVYRDKKVTHNAIFLSQGGKSPCTVENISVDEATLRYNRCVTPDDLQYFMKIMNPGNPFSEPPEEQLLFSKDVGVLVSYEEETPRNVFCFVKRSNRTNRNNQTKEDAIFEKNNQEAFDIATSVDPSFLFTIPNSKVKLNSYLSSTLILMRENLLDKLSSENMRSVD